jgi:hypothetical protein
MTTWAQQLDLEHSGDGALIDLDRLTIVADTPQRTGLHGRWRHRQRHELGVGYHLTVYLALQRFSSSTSVRSHRSSCSTSPAKPSSRAGRDRIAARSQSAEPPIHLRTTNPIGNQQAVTLTPHDPLIHRS